MMTYAELLRDRDEWKRRYEVVNMDFERMRERLIKRGPRTATFLVERLPAHEHAFDRAGFCAICDFEK